jgi:drug/metabolite transporter (DMT)-like permease
VTAPSLLQDRPLRGIAFMITAFTCVGVTDALSKAGVATMSTTQMLAIRSLMVLLLMSPWIVRAGGIAVFRTQKPREHATRIALSLVSMFSFFEALRHLELATAIAIGFVAPLIMTAISVPLLGERVGLHRWSAIAVGFVGALVILQPGADGFQPAALLCLLAAATWAASMVYVRRIARTDSDVTMLVYQNTAVLLVMGGLAPFFWAPIGTGELVLTAGMAASVVTGQWFMFRAFRFAPVGLIAPFQYLELLWAAILGWVIWNEFPDPPVWIGAAILVVSGLYVIWRERVRAREAALRAGRDTG